MSCLFIVRHGDTFAPGEAPRRIGARTDLPLVATGVAQAEALGRWFGDRQTCFARVLVGDLARARQTAELILHRLGCRATIETAEWLTEADHGPDENQPEWVVRARIGERALEAWDRNGVPPPDWLVDGAARLAAWRHFLTHPMPGDTLIVTSNGAARFALLACPELNGGSLRLRTGALGEIAMNGTRPRLIAWDVRPN